MEEYRDRLSKIRNVQRNAYSPQQKKETASLAGARQRKNKRLLRKHVEELKRYNKKIEDETGVSPGKAHRAKEEQIQEVFSGVEAVVKQAGDAFITHQRGKFFWIDP